MRKYSFLLLVALSISMLQADLTPENTMHGFKLIEKRFVQEVSADCYLFEHEGSGARLFKIANDDLNKTFCISFKTVTESDAGTPHILEHSVLNGSKNFPVKSPFDILAKGSLNTFLNAMTGSDITLYPVSSMNDKDFQTLMHIYLDAVFNPLIYEDPRILEQEGWHHELEDPDSAVSYKGVVYNEMRGAFSSPTREWGYLVDQYLFPDTPYRFSSGGYPKAIPTLSYAAFLDFHRKYYHPSNAYIFLYGNGDLDRELAFIDAEYLSRYSRPDTAVEIPLQTPFEALRNASGEYSASSGSSLEGESFLSLSFVTGLSADQELVMGLRILAQVLFNSESAPVRLALQEAGIGKDVSAWIDDLRQNVFHIRVQNANPDEVDAFRSIIYETLENVAAQGLDPKAVSGSLNRMEFSLREGDTANKGLYYNRRALASWFWTNDPFTGLEYETLLTDLKTGITNGFLENLIKTSFLENPHALVFTLNPRPGREAENEADIEAELATYKAGLSAGEIDQLVQHTADLVAYQREEDSPVALASIPLLELSDIEPKVDWYEVQELKTARIPYLHFETFTNNISYIRFFFDLRVLRVDQLTYARLLAVLLGSVGTENYSFGELDNALDAELGGFSTYLGSYLEDDDDMRLIPKFVVATKALAADQAKAFDLSAEIINHSLLSDTARIKDVLERHLSRLAASVKRDGRGYAQTRLYSYFSNQGVFDELTGGISYYWFVKDLVENFDNRKLDLVQEFESIQQRLFKRQNLIASVTCQASDLPEFKHQLKGFTKGLHPGSAHFSAWKLSQPTKNEGLLAASKVQYVLQGTDFKALGYEWSGKIMVLNQIISRDWLKNQVRVIGGAYGGYASFSSSGNMYFGSYRDPNLRETLENYAATPAFLAGFEADKDEMTRYIIGTISRMDRPLTASQRGSVAEARYFQHSSRLKLQEERDAVLASTAEDIKTYEKMIHELLTNSFVCVYGNEDKLKENRDLFEHLVPLD